MSIIDLSPSSTGNKFRAKRIQKLVLLINSVLERKGKCSIIDVGGTEVFWNIWRDRFDWNRLQVTCVNIDTSENLAAGPVTVRYGDARNLDGFEDNSFDICFSNSVIEHVGGWRDMVAMAHAVRRVAPAYFIQTPSFWFPIEPHARLPFIHWVPEQIRYRIVQRTRFGRWKNAKTVDQAMAVIESAKLLDYKQFAWLFSDASIERERFMGVTKSLIAIRV